MNDLQKEIDELSTLLVQQTQKNYDLQAEIASLIKELYVLRNIREEKKSLVEHLKKLKGEQ